MKTPLNLEPVREARPVQASAGFRTPDPKITIPSQGNFPSGYDRVFTDTAARQFWILTRFPHIV